MHLPKKRNKQEYQYVISRTSVKKSSARKFINILQQSIGQILSDMSIKIKKKKKMHW